MVRTSRLLMGSLLVLGFVATSRSAEPDKLLPTDTDAVVIVNFRQIIDSDLFKTRLEEKLKQELAKDEPRQFLTDLGLDPFKDVEKLIIASVNTEYKKDMQPKFLAIIRGKFDPQKVYRVMEGFANKKGDRFAMVKDGDTVMFRYQSDDGKQSIYGTAVNEKTLIAANEKKLITDALKAADANKPAQIKKELAALLNNLDEKASVTVASLLKDKLNELELPDGGGPFNLAGLKKALPGIETVAVTIKIATDVSLNASLGMKNATAAGDMRNAIDDLLRDLKGLLALAGDNPQAKAFGDALGAFRVTSKNKFVTFTGTITGESFGIMSTPRRAKETFPKKDKE